MVGAIIVAQQIEHRLEQEKTALQAYKIDIIPKLERVIDETKDDNEAQTLASDLFNTVEKEEIK